MKVGFPCYRSSFSCSCTVKNAMSRISETAARQHNNLKVLDACYSDAPKIILSANTGGYVYYNSFLPIVKVNMREQDGKTHLSLLFELQKSTKILMTLFALIAV